MVVIYEIDWSETAVFLYLTNHSPYAVAVIGVVLHRQTDAVVAGSDEFAVGGNVPAYSLMHHRLQVMGSREGFPLLSQSLWYRIFRK